MRLINIHTFELEEFLEPPPYAILSHRWREDELSFQNFARDIHDRHLQGSRKVRGFCRFTRKYEIDRAKGDWGESKSLKGAEYSQRKRAKDAKAQVAFGDESIEWAWVDTCCIDKTSSAELSEAINSMWRWYQSAKYCVAFLDDVPSGMKGTALANKIRNSAWFTRGWTLQELIAPTEVVFCDAGWDFMGLKGDDAFSQHLELCSGVQARCLQHPKAVFRTSVAQRMSWAAHRITTRREDIGYSLLGLFDVNLALMYGEGDKAFLRLQEEIMKSCDDESIFAWTTAGLSLARPAGSPLLATNPKLFRDSGNVERIATIPRTPYAITNRGLHFEADTAVIEYGGRTAYVVQISCADCTCYLYDPNLRQVPDHEDRRIPADSYKQEDKRSPCLLVLAESSDGLYHRLNDHSLSLRVWWNRSRELGRQMKRRPQIVRKKSFMLVTRDGHQAAPGPGRLLTRDALVGRSRTTEPEDDELTDFLFGRSM